MKHIRKGEEPAKLRAWRLANKSAPQNLIYRAIPGDALDAVRDALLKEQGHLCAYTMMRIAAREDGHVEHVVAQSQSPDTDLSVDYKNMVYCYPGNGTPRCAFGAHAKDGKKVSARSFVSPLDRNCESRFVFLRDGAVSSAKAEDVAALSTIAILNLDCEALRRARKAEIDSLPIFRKTHRPFSVGQAELLATKVLEGADDESFRPFAVALAQTLLEFAKKKAAKEAAMRVR